ncbi:ragulator complex protein LAMTOR1-like [Cimex lectularius]|uniref:Ragulator complex protein LAMTOR1 n=1 Tax=Cimex lectularius TaxID=79782 RepID=A0A8I6TG11_CIMLE|nr:ragulator complex protein LAMTOR1-like [Cimex lectularius]
MGCCFTYCCNKNKTQDDDPDVHTRLLSDPVSNSANTQCVSSDDQLAQYQNYLPKKANEQSVLNKILQTTAQNVIDVAALGPHNIEQNEYLERRNQYSSKLNHLASTARQPSINPQGLLVDIPVPEKILSGTPISDLDFKLIKRASHKFKVALGELKVKQTEDLIVPFHIGTM